MAVIRNRVREKTDSHQPVMLAAAISALALRPDGCYLDATFGRGGHSAALLAQLGPHGRLVALDRDPDAVTAARTLFADDPRFVIFHQSYAAPFPGQDRFDGILFDLGVSSPQLEDPHRGFSFLRDGPLDMRMDNTGGISAAEWIASVSEKQLVHVLQTCGEERFARRIARAILRTRAATPFVTTHQLAECIVRAVPVVPLFPKGRHPATRSFQAIRIAVNEELSHLEAGLQQAAARLLPAGRLVVISFHSLEDRRVKHFIRGETDTVPRKLPVRGETGAQRYFQSVGRARKADATEIAANPRARSAILRTGEKLP